MILNKRGCGKICCGFWKDSYLVLEDMDMYMYYVFKFYIVWLGLL